MRSGRSLQSNNYEGGITGLLPTVDKEIAGENRQTPVQGLYTEEEVRRAFPDLLSAVGMPNVCERG